MIDDEFAEWYATASVWTFQGTGAWGESHSAPQSVPAFWDFKSRLVVTSDGKQVTSESRLYCGSDHRAKFAEGSRVTLAGEGRMWEVVSVASWPGDDTHIEVNLA